MTSARMMRMVAVSLVAGFFVANLAMAPLACGSDYGDDPATRDGQAADASDAMAQPGDDGTNANVDAAPCPPLAAVPIGSGARTATVARSTSKKTIDGELDDWRQCPAFVLDPLTAADTRGAPAATAVVFLEWDSEWLYIAAEIEDAKLEGFTSKPYESDSFEAFVSGSTMRDGSYGPLDRHLVVDHRKVSMDFSRLDSPVLFPNGTSVVTANGYRVELKIEAAVFGGLSANKPMSFDAMLNDGVDQKNFLVWAHEPHTTCSCDAGSCDCNFSPAYDTLMFAPVTLE